MKQQPRHDQQLDLLCALEDVEDLDIARPLLEQFALAVPDAAAQLTWATVDLAAAVRKKRVSPSELVEAFIGRIEKANPRLNAVVGTRFPCPGWSWPRRLAAASLRADPIMTVTVSRFLRPNVTDW